MRTGEAHQPARDDKPRVAAVGRHSVQALQSTYRSLHVSGLHCGPLLKQTTWYDDSGSDWMQIGCSFKRLSRKEPLSTGEYQRHNTMMHGEGGTRTGKELAGHINDNRVKVGSTVV